MASSSPPSHPALTKSNAPSTVLNPPPPLPRHPLPTKPPKTTTVTASPADGVDKGGEYGTRFHPHETKHPPPFHRPAPTAARTNSSPRGGRRCRKAEREAEHEHDDDDGRHCSLPCPRLYLPASCPTSIYPLHSPPYLSILCIILYFNCIYCIIIVNIHFNDRK
jgi:hypothetical protein